MVDDHLDSDRSKRSRLSRTSSRTTSATVPRLWSSATKGMLQTPSLGSWQVRDLMNDLPDYKLASKLVDWFFTKVNFVRYPIDETLFRQSFEAVYAHGDIDHTTVLALPLVFMALAISMRVAPEEWAGPEEGRKTSSLKLYWDCESTLRSKADDQPRLRSLSPRPSRRNIFSLLKRISWYVIQPDSVRAG